MVWLSIGSMGTLALTDDLILDSVGVRIWLGLCAGLCETSHWTEVGTRDPCVVLKEGAVRGGPGHWVW